jgi:hypothetical protein
MLTDLGKSIPSEKCARGLINAADMLSGLEIFQNVGKDSTLPARLIRRIYEQR